MKKPHRKKHEPVDERLLATAGRCYLQHGFGYGIDRILGEAQVAKLSLYRNFGSKYGLIEQLLGLAGRAWEAEMVRAAKAKVQEPEMRVVYLLRNICAASRDAKKRTGLISQALIEFPRTEGSEALQEKEHLVHEKALGLQRDLVTAIAKFCGEAGAEDPRRVSEHFLLLANGYFISERLLGRKKALELTIENARRSILGMRWNSSPATSPSIQVIEQHPRQNQKSKVKRRVANPADLELNIDPL